VRSSEAWCCLLLTGLMSGGWAPPGLAGVSVAPSNGQRDTGQLAPAVVLWGHVAPPGPGVAEALAVLEEAWTARATLDPARAEALVSDLVDALRPTLDEGQGDVLQMALFLQGLLAVDRAGGFDALEDPLILDAQPIPRAWRDAVALRPALPAPAGSAELPRKAYDHARTLLMARGGLRLDPRGSGRDEVRLDGRPVSGEVLLLEGLHTLSWHPLGQPPRAILLRVGEPPRDGELDGQALAAWLQELAWAAGGEAGLPEDLRTELRRRLGTQAATLHTQASSATVSLLDAPQAPASRFELGAATGAWLYRDDHATLRDPCGESPWSDADTKLLVPLVVGASVAVGDWSLGGGAGLLQAGTPGSAVAASSGDTCSDGSPALAVMVPRLPLLWVGLGRRARQLGPWTLAPEVRLGSTGAYGLAQLGLGVQRTLDHGLVLVVDLHAGAAGNFWSGSANRSAVLAGAGLGLRKGVDP